MFSEKTCNGAGTVTVPQCCGSRVFGCEYGSDVLFLPGPEILRVLLIFRLHPRLTFPSSSIPIRSLLSNSYQIWAKKTLLFVSISRGKWNIFSAGLAVSGLNRHVDLAKSCGPASETLPHRDTVCSKWKQTLLNSVWEPKLIVTLPAPAPTFKKFRLRLRFQLCRWILAQHLKSRFFMIFRTKHGPNALAWSLI
jgi:hypothetical protein